MDLPHYVHLERKRESDSEVHNLACGRSGTMINLALVKSVVDSSRQAFDFHLQHVTAVICTLTQQWNRSGRVICADLYFSRVSTAEVLQEGPKSNGVIKTTIRKYPKVYLANIEVQGRLAYASMESKNSSEFSTWQL